MPTYPKFHGAIIGGAIGDALGSKFENQEPTQKDSTIFVWGNAVETKEEWNISDDTQLTLATAESILQENGVNAASIAKHFLRWYESRKLSGLGSATLQSLRGMQNGGHWALVGKKGEMAAGNGAAMRIAPLAFWKESISGL